MKTGDLVTYRGQIYIVIEEDPNHQSYIVAMNIETSETSLFPRGFLTILKTDKN